MNLFLANAGKEGALHLFRLCGRPAGAIDGRLERNLLRLFRRTSRCKAICKATARPGLALGGTFGRRKAPTLNEKRNRCAPPRGFAQGSPMVLPTKALRKLFISKQNKKIQDSGEFNVSAHGRWRRRIRPVRELTTEWSQGEYTKKIA